MESPASLAWQQLAREKRRLLVAVTGVAFAVLLMLMQLGFRDSLFGSTVLLHRLLRCDLVLIGPQTSFIATLRPFSQRRLYQALGTPGVASVSPLYVDVTPVGWANRATGELRSIYVVGFDLSERVLEMPALEAQLEKLKLPDVVLFDALSRKEYGPVAEEFRAGRPVATEVNRRRISVVGLFELGTSFAVDGTLITSDANFLRILPHRQQGLIDIGLVRLVPGADAEEMRALLQRKLPDDVLVLTKNGYIAKEIGYWAQSTPIGFVFAFGAIMGFFIGAVIVYQILFADVSEHLPEYATLKALGFTNLYLRLVVMCQAVILALLGYIPGVLVSLQLYRLTASATRLPMFLSPSLALLVLGLTTFMCAVSGLLALRRVEAADPADIF